MFINSCYGGDGSQNTLPSQIPKPLWAFTQFTEHIGGVNLQSITYREALETDIPSVALIRSKNSEEKSYWLNRIEQYRLQEHNPQMALPPRIIYVAIFQGKIVGFVAGHLTRRFNCDGELQWIDTIVEFRRRGIASHLVKMIAKWFLEKNACKICVDPGSQPARRFYKKNGAKKLNQHWMYWEDIRSIS